jgi:hypothetical protein
MAPLPDAMDLSVGRYNHRNPTNRQVGPTSQTWCFRCHGSGLVAHADGMADLRDGKGGREHGSYSRGGTEGVLGARNGRGGALWGTRGRGGSGGLRGRSYGDGTLFGPSSDQQVYAVEE